MIIRIVESSKLFRDINLKLVYTTKGETGILGHANKYNLIILALYLYRLKKLPSLPEAKTQ
jgi:hypothetical protein